MELYIISYTLYRLMILDGLRNEINDVSAVGFLMFPSSIYVLDLR